MNIYFKLSITVLIAAIFSVEFTDNFAVNFALGRETLPGPRRQAPKQSPPIRGDISVVQLDESNLCLVGSYQQFLADRFAQECGPFLRQLAKPEFRPQDWSYRFHYNFAAAEVIEAYRPQIARAYQDIARISITDSRGKRLSILQGGYWINPISAMHLPDASTGADQIVHAAEVLHFTFLQLAAPLKEGEKYTIVNSLGEQATFCYSVQNRSDALKANQVGYAAESGRKYAYLGSWRGPELQARDYSAWNGQPFSLIDLKNGQTAYQGKIRLRETTEQAEAFTGEKVGELDFSDFNVPGNYQIRVPGVGSSWPFQIGGDALGEAFYVRMRGMYHKRCGCLKQLPYTAWTAQKGLEIAEKSAESEKTAETEQKEKNKKAEEVAQAGETGQKTNANKAGKSDKAEKAGRINSLNKAELSNNASSLNSSAISDAKPSVCHAVTYQGNFPPNWRHYGTRGDSGFYDQQGNKYEVKTFDLIHETCRPTQPLPGVFGGWHDAADYDRRSLHLQSVGDFTAAYLMFPNNFSDGQLNIPESGNGIPDILDEAVWGAMVWLRAQKENGGVGCWIEADSHPKNDLPETDEQPYYLALPTMESSADYSGYAAALAFALKQAGAAELSETFQQSAQKAYQFAKDTRNRLVVQYQDIPVRINGKMERKNLEYRESPALSGAALGKAAFNLYWLTGDKQYLSDFRSFRRLGLDAYMKDLSWAGSPLYWSELAVWGASQESNSSAGAAGGGNSSARSADSPELSDFRELYQIYREQTIRLADERLQELNDNYQYRMPWYAPEHAYVSHMSWGNYQPLNRARPFVAAWRLTGDVKYRDAALLCNDWELGANPTNSSMTSGLGKNYPVRFLDLPSYSDGIDEFVPGITPYRNTFGLSRPAVEMAWGLFYEKRQDHDFKGCQISLLPKSLTSSLQTIEINEYAKKVGGAIPVLRRFANVEGWSVAASEFTVWETIAPQAAITGCLLQPGWKPGAELKNRRPIENFRDLPGMTALP